MAKLVFQNKALSLQEKPKPAAPQAPITHFKGSDQQPLFEQLLPCTWRDIHFPVSSISLSFEQDLVQHKYWGVDGADCEATGRGVMRISAEIPFVNHIVPGKQERWGLLYPTEFRKFLRAFADRSTGSLQHPELGYIDCKPHSLEFKHEAHTRDGVFVTATWVETASQNINDLDPNAVGSSPVQNAADAALSLDAALKSAPEELPTPPESFESLVNKLAGVFDTTTSKIQLLQHKPTQILYHLQRLEHSMTRSKNALSWPIDEATQLLKEALHPKHPNQDVLGTPPAASATTQGRPVGRQKLSQKTTLSMLQGLFPNNTVDQLMYLNPSLMQRPTVPAGSVVRYYK